MTHSKSKIGSMECEISLNSILTKLNDAYINKKVMSLYNSYKEGFKELESIRGCKIFEMMITMFRNHHFNNVENMNLPYDLKTHLKCCMIAHYRNMIKSSKLKIN
jgi:hypothetical protein